MVAAPQSALYVHFFNANPLRIYLERCKCKKVLHIHPHKSTTSLIQGNKTLRHTLLPPSCWPETREELRKGRKKGGLDCGRARGKEGRCEDPTEGGRDCGRASGKEVRCEDLTEGERDCGRASNKQEGLCEGCKEEGKV